MILGKDTIPSEVVYDGTTYRVTSIGEYAFYGCSGLTSITIPDCVTQIGFSAFSYCYNLISVVTGDGVFLIDNNAFAYCCELTSVTLGKSVILIGDGAFCLCRGLKEIISKASTPPACNSNVFQYVTTTDCTLYLSDNATAYLEAKPWSNFGNIVGGSTMPAYTCKAPNITFDNDTKKLMFASETEGAECHYSVTSEDFKSEKKATEATMTGIYTITAYASAEGMYNSEKTTAKLVWVSAAIESDGILEAKADRGVIVSSNGDQINISGTIGGETIEVYNVGGSKVKSVKASGNDTTISGLQSGNVYIVKIGGTKVKVAM